MLCLSTLDEMIDRALAEDLGSGDVTSQCCVEPTVQAHAVAIAKAPLVVCGGPVFARVFARCDPATRVECIEPEGQEVPAATVLWRVAGSARSLLGAERVALNFVQRLAGIATLARRFVQALPAGSRTRIADTRKTTPGLRALERYAVRTGGAHNHRDNLASAVLIKDNHIAAAGSITCALERARERAPHSSRLEVEVRSAAELDEALRCGAEVILLDNMDGPTIAAEVRRIRATHSGPLPVLEASGGVTLAQVAELARAGVEVISVGALTHSAPAADISLDFVVGRDTDPPHGNA